MGMKLGFSQRGKQNHCEYLTEGCEGEYLNVRGCKGQKDRDNDMIKVNDLYPLTNCKTTTKSRIVRWAENVARCNKKIN